MRPKTPNIDNKLFALLLRPSWLGAIGSLWLSLLLTVGTIVLVHYQSSSVRLDFLNYQAQQLFATYQHVGNGLAGNTFVSNLPLLIFWSLVGFVVYLFVINIFTIVHNTHALKDELHYVNADRRSLIRSTVRRSLIRLGVVAVWMVYIIFFLHHILPYCIAASVAGSAALGSLQDDAYALLAIVVMCVALQVHILLLRLLLLRPRVFSGDLYIV